MLDHDFFPIVDNVGVYVLNSLSPKVCVIYSYIDNIYSLSCRCKCQIELTMTNLEGQDNILFSVFCFCLIGVHIKIIASDKYLRYRFVSNSFWAAHAKAKTSMI